MAQPVRSCPLNTIWVCVQVRVFAAKMM